VPSQITPPARVALGRPAEFTRSKAHCVGHEKSPQRCQGLKFCVDGVGKNRRVEPRAATFVIARRRRRPKKKPRLIRPGQVCLRHRAARSEPKPREAILPRRRLGRDREKGGRSRPLNFSSRSGLHLRKPTIGRQGPLYVADPSMSAAGRCGHFN
jgi:hypothetical protein